MTRIGRYRNANAFRSAIEAHLRHAANAKGSAWLVRQRKFMVFDRLLARLFLVAPDRWLLKGAVALDFRLGDQARATMDLDLARLDDEQTATDDLHVALALDLADFFAFSIERTSMLDALIDDNAVRYRVTADLDGRRFEQVTLDVGFHQEIVSTPDLLIGPEFFAFAGIPPIQVPALSLEQHVAEKLHAYTRIYANDRRSSRVKDLVDLVLIAEHLPLDANALNDAIVRTFTSRATHAAPKSLPVPPSDWPSAYRVLATDSGLEPDIRFGHAIAARFLNPVLNQAMPGTARWSPKLGSWKE